MCVCVCVFVFKGRSVCVCVSVRVFFCLWFVNCVSRKFLKRKDRHRQLTRRLIGTRRGSVDSSLVGGMLTGIVMNAQHFWFQIAAYPPLKYRKYNITPLKILGKRFVRPFSSSVMLSCSKLSIWMRYITSQKNRLLSCIFFPWRGVWLVAFPGQWSTIVAYVGWRFATSHPGVLWPWLRGPAMVNLV